MMDPNGTGQGWAAFNTVLSICSAFIAFIGIADVQKIAAFIATGVAIMSGCLASRYYYLAIKEKKQTLKKNNF